MNLSSLFSAKRLFVLLKCYRVVEQLQGKTQVMKLLAHDDPNVRYHALLAVQKLMVHNWEYLGKQIEAPAEDKDGANRKPMQQKNN